MSSRRVLSPLVDARQNIFFETSGMNRELFVDLQVECGTSKRNRVEGRKVIW